MLFRLQAQCCAFQIRSPRRPRFVPRLTPLEDRIVPSYVFQTIDDPNGVGYNSTESINSSGQIAGLYLDATGAYHGYLYSGGQFTTINEPNIGPGGSTLAYTVNDSGRLVGAYSDAAGLTHGYLLSGGQFTTIDDPNAIGVTQAVGVNANGKIVGFYTDATNNAHGFLRSGGQYTTVDDPNAGAGPNQGTFIDEINARGQMVGEYVDANNVAHGFLLSNGQFTTIDNPGATGNFQFAGFINDHGLIAGGYLDAAGTYHGYLYSNGQFTTVDYPGAGPFGSYIAGVNNAGTIVGLYYDSAGNVHGYEATPAHGNSDAAQISASAIMSPDSAVVANSFRSIVVTPPMTTGVGGSVLAASAGPDKAAFVSSRNTHLGGLDSLRPAGANRPASTVFVDVLFADLGLLAGE
jgi:hypothetical protein